MKPYRKRLVSKYHIINDLNIKRLQKTSFSQSDALVLNKEFDFRKIPGKFKETPEEMDNNDFIKIVSYISKKIAACENTDEFILTVHYTIIEDVMHDASSNSPEGIHQDGMDYIVSAIVLERENIHGGVSKIYMGDKNNEISLCKKVLAFFRWMLAQIYGMRLRLLSV